MKILIILMVLFGSSKIGRSVEKSPVAKENYRFSRLLQLANLRMDLNDARIVKLLAGQSPDIVGMVGKGDSVYRVWGFNSWGDALYTMKVSGDRAEVTRRSSQHQYQAFLLPSEEGKASFKSGMDEVLLTALPLPVKRPGSHEDETVYLIENVSAAGEYSWAIRSLNLTTEESVVKLVSILNATRKFDWKELK